MKYTELSIDDKNIINLLNIDDLINIESITKKALENKEDNLEIVIKLIEYITKEDLKSMKKDEAIILINKYSILTKLFTLEWDSEEENFTIDNKEHSLKRLIMKDEMSFGTYAALVKEFENTDPNQNIKTVIAYMIDYSKDKEFNQNDYTLINKIPLHIVMSFISFFLSNLEIYKRVTSTYSQITQYNQMITSLQKWEPILESTTMSGTFVNRIRNRFINLLNTLSVKLYFFSISTIMKIKGHIATKNLKKAKSK
jgi:hypothetical protein